MGKCMFFSISFIVVFCSYLPASFGAEKKPGVARPEWYEDLLFENKSFSSQLARNLAWTYAGAADIGEVISTARKIKDGDIVSWHKEWLKTADRIHKMASE